MCSVTVPGIVVQAAAIALLMGAILGAYAWNLPEPSHSSLLKQAKWLAIPGYFGVGIWAAVLTYGVFVRGCDPVFGGWTRTPVWDNYPVSELLSCSETPMQARVKPELAAQYPYLPTRWSHVFLHYEEAADLPKREGTTWIFSMQTDRTLLVPSDRLEFRPAPPWGGKLVPWQPQEADPSW